MDLLGRRTARRGDHGSPARRPRPRHERTTPAATTIDAFDAPASGLTGGFDRAAHLRTVIDPAIVTHAERIVAERHGTSLADAAAVLSAYAHGHGRRLPDVARAVIDGSLVLSDSDTIAHRV